MTANKQTAVQLNTNKDEQKRTAGKEKAHTIAAAVGFVNAKGTSLKAPKQNKLCHTPEWKKQALRAIASRLKGDDSDTQRKRFKEALQRFPVSTYEAMRYLDIYDPRPRIWELRNKEGLDILTIPIRQQTESGKPHPIGMYVLKLTPKNKVAA